MNFSIFNFHFSIPALLVLSSFALAVGPRNLALHKKLDYNPKPEYALTIHPSDPFKLTDGIKGVCLWYEDYREKTAGWMGAGRVEIVLDLGQIENVGLIKIYTIGGGRGGVEYPEYAIVASSLNGDQYAFSSFVTSEGWEFGGDLARPRTIALPVERRARYLKLYVSPIEQCFFTDEIEALESKSAELETPSDFLSKDSMIDLVERARQLQRDMAVLKAKANGWVQTETVFQSELSRVETAIAGLTRKISLSDVSHAESEFLVCRAKVLRSRYNADWLCYQADPMDVVRYGDLPENISNKAEISLYQWQNEYGIAAINLVNCSNAELMFKAGFSPLRFQEQSLDSANIFELRRAVYVRVKNAGLVADPLVLQNAKPFPVAPGQMVQLWLEASAKGLKPGKYTAALAIDVLGDNLAKTQQNIPIQLEIAGKMFPDKLPFYSCNWDYVTSGDRFTSKSQPQIKCAAADLGNHYTNVNVILYAKVSDDKAVLSLDKLRSELALRGKTQSIALLFMGGKGLLEKRFGSFRSAQWESNFNFFLSRFRDFMLSNGFGYDSFALYPFDEDIGEDFVYVAQMIRRFDPKLKIYADKWFESKSRFNQTKDLIDIWSPGIFDVLSNKNQYDRYQDMKIFDQVWCYTADLTCERFFVPPYTRAAKDGRTNNKTFWRTLPITAAYLKMQGAGFWTYQDSDRTGWMKDKPGNYGVIYDGTVNPDKNCIPELIVPSKRWQQWRQGVEDAVCLTGHKDLLDEFFQTPNNKLTSDYITSLRKRADEKAVSN